jgi:ribosomal protein S18 acetylase RimI-like enzyme
MRLREANRDDAAAIARLHAESWRKTFDFALTEEFRAGPIFEDRQAAWEERLSAPPPNQFVLLAEDGDKLAGFACTYGADDERWGSLLDNLHVDSRWQGHGLGKRLTKMTAEWCVVNYPADGMYLWVLDGNARARRMYEMLGAEEVEQNTVGNINGGEEWRGPDGDDVGCRRYAWTPDQVRSIPKLVDSPDK